MYLFLFDELTWTSLGALPRETLLVLPLGDHPDGNAISTPAYYMDWIEGGALIANPLL